MKLIFKSFYSTADGMSESIIPFEYSSKEQFLLDVYDKWDKLVKEAKDKYYSLKVMGEYLYANDIENLEHNIFSLEEWFNKETKTNEIF